MSSALLPAPVSPPPSPAPAAPIRARARAARRRKAARPPRPQTPADLFPPEAYALLVDLLAARAKAWQWDTMPPVFYYGRDSEPLWGDYALHRCSGATLHSIRKSLLYESLCVDLERGLRLLTLKWTARDTTADGHTSEEWRLSFSGVLWRLGQLYREVARRQGQARALEVLRLAMDTLWR